MQYWQIIYFLHLVNHPKKMIDNLTHFSFANFRVYFMVALTSRATHPFPYWHPLICVKYWNCNSNLEWWVALWVFHYFHRFIAKVFWLLSFFFPPAASFCVFPLIFGVLFAPFSRAPIFCWRGADPITDWLFLSWAAEESSEMENGKSLGFRSLNKWSELSWAGLVMLPEKQLKTNYSSWKPSPRRNAKMRKGI